MRRSFYPAFNVFFGIFVCWTLYLWYESPGLEFIVKTEIVIGNVPLLLLMIGIFFIPQRIWPRDFLLVPCFMFLSQLYIVIAAARYLYVVSTGLWHNAWPWWYSASFFFLFFMSAAVCAAYFFAVIPRCLNTQKTSQKIGMPIKLGIGLGILLLLMVSSSLNSMVTANFACNQAVSRVYCELESVQRAIDPVNGSRAGLFNSFDALSIALLEYSNYDKRLTLDRFEIVHMLSNGIATDAESFTELEQRRLVTVRNAIFKFQSSLRVHMALIPNTNGPNYYSKQLSTEYFSACYQIFVLDLTRTTDGFPSA